MIHGFSKNLSHNFTEENSFRKFLNQLWISQHMETSFTLYFDVPPLKHLREMLDRLSESFLVLFKLVFH